MAAESEVSRTEARSSAAIERIALALVMMAVAAILLYFHNRFWMPRDDGYFAHIAERILRGDKLHADIQALHPGAVYYANAMAFYLFGHDFVSLRYPLIAIGLTDGALAFALLRPRGLLWAVTAALAVTALTLPQFFSPSPHWYCLPLILAIMLLLDRPEWRWRIEAIGFLIGALFLFRQLTGIFAAMGVLTYLFISSSPQGSPRLARAVIAIMAGGLAFYLVGKTDPAGWVMFGIWPLLLLALAFRDASADDRQTLSYLLRLSAGGILAILPIIIWNAMQGTLAAWFSDAFLAAVAQGEMAYQKAPIYLLLVLLSLRQLLTFDTFSQALNALYWLAVLFGSMALGAHMVSRFFRKSSISPLPVIALFYALVAVHFQAAAYVYFAIGPIIVALLWCVSEPRHRISGVAFIIAVIISATALYYHAGQPWRDYSTLIRGDRIPVGHHDIAALARLNLTADDATTYAQVLGLIDHDSAPGDAILAVPAGAELYFLSGRHNPLRYDYLQFGIQTDAELTNALEILSNDRPQIVFYLPGLSYNTDYTNRVMDWVRENYKHAGTIREFEVYEKP